MKCGARLRVKRFRTGPGPEPGQAIRFREHFVRVRFLRDRRRAEENSNDNGDVADQMKTAARHDSLSGFAGAPSIFYNRVKVAGKELLIEELLWGHEGRNDRAL